MILRMKYLILPALLLVSACADMPRLFPDRSAQTAAPQSETGPYAGIRPGVRPGETGAETPVAVAPATGDLGTTVASLGNAAEPGLWLKTPLVDVAGSGQVAYAATGKTVTAQLIPIEGPRTAGSRASLQLMQALGAPLTGLPEVRVSR